jgi:tetratricopeptide (TPR) repeat protein
MTRQKVRELINALADHYGLRYIESEGFVLGLHRGTVVSLSESSGVLTFQFASPTVNLCGEALGHFEGFEHCREAGLPVGWLDYGGRCSCSLVLGKYRLGEIDVETFARIPELVVRDFEAHGASQSLECPRCEERDAAYVAYVNGQCVPLCSECWLEAGARSEPRKESLAKRILVPAVVMACILAGIVYLDREPSDGSAEERSHAACELAVDAMERKAHRRAIEHLNEAIRLDPDNVAAYTLRGDAYGELGQSDRAIASYNEAVRLIESRSVEVSHELAATAYNNRGNEYLRMGQPDRTIADCTKAMGFDSDFALPYTNRGLAYATKGMLDEAVADYGEAIRCDPKDYRPYYNRGLVLLDKRHHPRAAADFTTAIQLNPTSGDVWRDRGTARFREGKFDDALADYKQALHLNPQDEEALAARFVAAASERLDRLRLPTDGKPGPTSRGKPPAAQRVGDDVEFPPPTVRRVASRAIVLTAVFYRSLLEQWTAGNPRFGQFPSRLVDWLDAIGLSAELEPQERDFLVEPMGQADQQATIDASWRNEGLVVLVWALGRSELPSYDAGVADVLPLADGVGFLDTRAAKQCLHSAELRPFREIEEFTNRIMLVHWALVNAGEGDSTGLAGLQATPFYSIIGRWLNGVRLIDGELAVGGKSFSAVSDDERTCLNSRVRERHVAAFWLEGQHAVYSSVGPHTVLFSRVLIDARKGDADAAIRMYSKCLEQEPGATYHLGGRGWAYIRKAEYAKAIADLDRAVGHQPLVAWHVARGWALLHSGNAARAETDANKAWELDQEYPWTRALLFRASVAQGRRTEAVRQARLFLATPPANEQDKAVRLLLRHFLGEVALEALRKHREWPDYEVAVRGCK